MDTAHGRGRLGADRPVDDEHAGDDQRAADDHRSCATASPSSSTPSAIAATGHQVR